MKNPTYVEVHVLQTVPPSNLNRDDAGTPKQAIYGGVGRARVSSQSWKRATRKVFEEGVPEEQQATRTKRIAELLTNRLVVRTGLEPGQAVRLATFLLAPLGIKPGKKAAETAYLLFLGRGQVDGIVDLVLERAQELAELNDEGLEKAIAGLQVKAELLKAHPLDVALFGRMVADVPGLNVDAAAQVAHAISTHPVEIEFDYYTAVDDEKGRAQDEDAGAGMIGTIEFNSATLYRYANVGLHQLMENLGDASEEAVEAAVRFVDGFVRSMPTGHQNSFAHRTLPSVVAVIVRRDQPVNLVSAFEEPVRSRNGQAALSAQRLATEFTSIQERWALAPTLVVGTYDSTQEDSISRALQVAFGDSVSFPNLLAALKESLSQCVAGGM